MKKQITLFVMSALILSAVSVKSQTSLTTAVDFSVTDVHGNSLRLFDILDRGQYVFIDFFFTTCGPCQSTTPTVVSTYGRYGCNEKDIFFMGVSPSDNDAACQAWDAQYGITYPTIGTSGGGPSICNSYGVSAYPTFVLIAPDRTIVEQDLWPISSAGNVFASHGITEYNCTSSIVSHRASEKEQKIKVFPNPTTDYLTIEIEQELEGNAFIEIFDITGSLIMKETVSDRNCLNVSNLSNGMYVIKVEDAVVKFSKY